ncbi:ABC-type amino acid transport/signal transduction systems, periplasmic component/domain [Hahella chejuensis KCTC 2396]|uniref:ABC-type amino acid transport/signal transduction systems, periplasmic component/domain n=1 Tax=Hahella chejuensis (strain KCTC 2396) TaxID=349521 RepID=Q2SKH5_HAHCH|nr:transporter substrate-binding domain-containing protein [Hahella chejuensis]ABC28849.1 ABC-type amino acid transport/signal transduction systems, periplasmic component/domain [Hahella chejuensis KCTC 2396]
MTKKLIRLYLAIILLFTVSISPSYSVGLDKKITLLTGDYPPYEIESSKDGLVGYDVEVVNAVFQRAGYEVDIRFFPWKRAINQIESGHVSGGFSIANTPERRKICELSDPISSITPVLAVRADLKEPRPKTLTETLSYRGIGIRGYTFQQELASIGAPHTILNTDEQALLFLTKSRADVFYTVKESSQFLVKSMGLENQIQFVRLQDKEVDYFYVCFSKAWPNYEIYVDVFNKGLKVLKDEGLYDQIHRKYE